MGWTPILGKSITYTSLLRSVTSTACRVLPSDDVRCAKNSPTSGFFSSPLPVAWVSISEFVAACPSTGATPPIASMTTMSNTTPASRPMTSRSTFIFPGMAVTSGYIPASNQSFLDHPQSKIAIQSAPFHYSLIRAPPVTCTANCAFLLPLFGHLCYTFPISPPTRHLTFYASRVHGPQRPPKSNGCTPSRTRFPLSFRRRGPARFFPFLGPPHFIRQSLDVL